MFEWSSAAQTVETDAGDSEADERPAKKQKTDTAKSGGSNILKLAISSSNRHVVVVTEDKTVRVFEISADGKLEVLSNRAMPKRPCAIDILPDNTTILCGDKFGDVYSMPLLPDPGIQPTDASSGAEFQHPARAAQPFKPSASNTTVHTKRNLKSLAAQLKQKNLTPKTKEPLKFEHKLLLGHVSMLTDLKHATREMNGQQRSYIITADRDEHIRVSRGPPQSHIIEGYCLGHTEFINKICLVPGSDLLISGGGDSWVGVWDWPSFKLRRKIEILDTLRESPGDSPDGTDIAPTAVYNINISGVWSIPMRAGGDSDKPAMESALVVACEAVPAMLVCPVAKLLADNASFQCIPLVHGPVLDLTSIGETIFATFDDRNSEGRHRIQSFHMERDAETGSDVLKCIDDIKSQKSLDRLNDFDAPTADAKALDELIYGVVNLRKRGYQKDEADGEAEAALDDQPEEAIANDID